MRLVTLGAMIAGLVLAAPIGSGAGHTSAPSLRHDGSAQGSVPRFDHVVVVFEENRAFSQIINSKSAPYINMLAAQGASFTQSHGVQHPSQPNYIALFSGSTQGVRNDSCPHSFATPNLATELIAGGLSFGGYAESLPSVGSTVCNAGHYARRHNPWPNFTNVPPALNMPFASFPSDYSQLPTVSMVVPNLSDDMHSGSTSRGDAWLQTNLDGYIQWAKTHNSLFVLTWDEGGNGNHIPTLFVGPTVNPGQYGEHIDHYDVLRTIEDVYGLAPLGVTAGRSPIVDVWR